MGRRQTIWLDRNRTRTAADLDEIGHCDAFIRRLSADVGFLLERVATAPGAPRDIEELLASRELSVDIPRPQRQALFYKKRGLIELRRRREQLSRQG